MIGPFEGPFRFLSNFYPCEIAFAGLVYPSVEHAYQAAKTEDRAERRNIRDTWSPGGARAVGRKVTLRPDWDEVKAAVMLQLLHTKFERGTSMAAKLLATDDEELVEVNTWGDTYWGVCDGEGENVLGRLLMEVRRELSTPFAEWKASQSCSGPSAPS
jgi:ribA/ribD-fused uncharacterized protein